MARYNIRDLLGHWVKPRSMREKMCPHACCRNKRVHPSNFPVILPNKLLRRATDNELMQHWRTVQGDADKDERARAQILHEMERRDQADIRRQEKRDAYKARVLGKRLERAEAVDFAWLQAEQATKGNMLNRAGKAAWSDERSLFTGPESRARRYASEELLNHWQDHPRPTAAFFAGEDTRLGAQYTAPRRRLYGVRAGQRVRVSARRRAA
jgi:hypothetical protein